MALKIKKTFPRTLTKCYMSSVLVKSLLQSTGNLESTRWTVHTLQTGLPFQQTVHPRFSSREVCAVFWCTLPKADCITITALPCSSGLFERRSAVSVQSPATHPFRRPTRELTTHSAVAVPWSAGLLRWGQPDTVHVPVRRRRMAC